MEAFAKSLDLFISRVLCSSRIRHRNEFAEKAWEDAGQELGNDVT